jgi:hypothetical protein
MALLATLPAPFSELEPSRHPGRPPLSPEEREARRQARNQARRDQRRAVREAKTPPVPVEPAPLPLPAPPPPPTPASVAPTPRVYFSLGQRARALLGFGVGAFVPLASYTVVHVEVDQRPGMWFLVAGGLVYSSISVYMWAVKMFHWKLRALGFVALLECTLTFCEIRWLSLAGLVILMLLNALNAAVALQQSEPPTIPKSAD